MRSHRITALSLLLILSLALSACSLLPIDVTEDVQTSGALFPLPEENIPPAPCGDKTAGEIFRASVYYAAQDGSISVPSTRAFWLTDPSEMHLRLAEELMKTPGGDQLPVVPANSRIAFTEFTFPTLTVNVLPGAVMDEDDVRRLATALTRTMLPYGITGVNVLVSGRAVSVGGLPVGVMDENTDLAMYRDEGAHIFKEGATGSSITRNACLYYPSIDQKCVLAQTARISIGLDNPVLSVLNALDSSFTANCFEKPVIYTVSPSGDRVLNLYLTKEAFDARRWPDERLYLACITLTLTSLLPETDGILVYAGGTAITEVETSAGVQRFENGILTRQDFAHLIGTSVCVYVKGENGMLVREHRPMPLSDAASPRMRLLALAKDPMNAAYAKTFPDGFKNSDILGISISENVAHVNLSAECYRLCQAFTGEEEELFVYSLVNTLAELENVSGVRLYFDGKPAYSLAQNVHLTGVLLPNPGRVSE